MRAHQLVGRPVAAMLLVLAACGCGGSAPTPGGSSPATSTVEQDKQNKKDEQDEQDERDVAVYAAVLRHHLTSWNQGDPVPPVVYVLERAVPEAADPMRGLDGGGGEAIDSRIRERLATELADVTAVRFIAATSTVTTGDTGCVRVKDHGAVLTLAPLPASGNQVSVGLADFRACLDGRWQTYVVNHTAGGWTVQGITGPVSVA